jgi:ABC-2 type transport system ATP-binding protein
MVVRTPDIEAARRVLATFGLAHVPGNLGDDVTAEVVDGGVPPESVVAALVAAGVRVRGFEVQESSLEDRFVALTGEGFDVAG